MNEYIDQRVAEIEAFEARARGDVPHRSKRSDTTAQRRPPTSQTTEKEVSTMSLFETAVSTTAHLKAGFMGKQGAGKSMTGGLLAIGLVKHLKQLGITYANKPVAFFDTETGSDWLIPLF